jgi:exopolyphosphatase/guanosine-5'-triphosphate,3'-diphosphate pyrophosphatase
MIEMGSQYPESVAAVDLGSNSFHMLVARTDGGEPVIVDRLREMVRLAGGLGKRKRLTRKSQERAIECLRRFGQRLHHMPRGSVRAVGTNTLRSAHNAGQFLRAAEAALGHPIDVISGIEEARLVFLGATQSLPDPEKQKLVVDIGGGSTELIIGRRFQPVTMQSLYMGCVSMSRKFFPGGAVDPDAWQKAELAARQELEPIVAGFRKTGWDQAVGTSGTIRAIQSVIRLAGWNENEIRPGALKKLRDELIRAGSVKRFSLDGLSHQRRPVFPGGVVVLLSAFKALRIRSMQLAEGALREGLLYDLLGRIREEDVRERTVVALADRSHVDWQQAGRVEHTSLYCLNQVAEAWGITDRESRQLLCWAALLHEIGLDIAHSHYHKHGEYIIEMADLFGFSRQEQKLLAVLVRSHRRKLAMRRFHELPENRFLSVFRLAVLLRLAVVLNRSRSPEMLPEFELTAGRRSLKLRFPDGWLDAHPLTRAGLEHEASYLKAGEFKLGFS